VRFFGIVRVVGVFHRANPIPGTSRGKCSIRASRLAYSFGVILKYRWRRLLVVWDLRRGRGCAGQATVYGGQAYLGGFRCISSMQISTGGLCFGGSNQVVVCGWCQRNFSLGSILSTRGSSAHTSNPARSQRE